MPFYYAKKVKETNMEFKKLKIADLVPASYNPRKALKPGDAEYEKIKNSITEFGAWMRHRKSDGDFSRCRIRHDRCGSVRRHA